jgi:crotonobetainyl-CoA:carnitine CoA-transferase CaiB-like acyl-CoA transferase
MDIPQLRQRHPHLVVLSLTPFGRSGPLRDTPATDFTLQHRAALAYAMATPVNDPEKRGPLAGADHEGPLGVGVAGAMSAVWGLLVAQSGATPPHIDLASYDWYAHIASDGLAQWLAGERTFPRRRVRKEGTEAAGGLTWILPCNDGWVMVSPREQHQWDRWVAMLGNPDWSRDAALCGTRVERRSNWSQLQTLMAEWSKQLPPDEVARQAQAVSVACFPISTPGELLRNAQLQQRQLFDRLVSSRGAEASVPGLPFRIETSGGALPRGNTRHSPALGEANQKEVWS